MFGSRTALELHQNNCGVSDTQNITLVTSEYIKHIKPMLALMTSSSQFKTGVITVSQAKSAGITW